MSDAYHTCYVLSGLSSVQHEWDLGEPEASEEEAAAAAAAAADLEWTVLPYLVQIFDPKDLVRPIHPIYAIPQQNVRVIKEYFQAKQGF